MVYALSTTLLDHHISTFFAEKQKGYRPLLQKTLQKYGFQNHYESTHPETLVLTFNEPYDHLFRIYLYQSEKAVYYLLESDIIIKDIEANLIKSYNIARLTDIFCVRLEYAVILKAEALPSKKTPPLKIPKYMIKTEQSMLSLFTERTRTLLFGSGQYNLSTRTGEFLIEELDHDVTYKSKKRKKR